MKTFRSSDGLTLAYQEHGEGNPVLCLAGLTRSSRDFQCLIDHLPDVRLIMPDYRGRGCSDWDSSPLNYNPMVEMRDAIELIDHLGIRSVKIIGTSRGGIIAMLMALTAKQRVDGILFNDIGPVIERKGLDRIMQYLGKNPDCENLDDVAAMLASGSPEFVDVPAEKWRQEAENRYHQVGNKVCIRYDPGLRESFVAALSDSDTNLWQQFNALTSIPLALIRGENSDLLSEQTAKQMLEVCPNQTQTIALQRGHCPFLDEPESLDAIRQFLKASS